MSLDRDEELRWRLLLALELREMVEEEAARLDLSATVRPDGVDPASATLPDQQRARTAGPRPRARSYGPAASTLVLPHRLPGRRRCVDKH